MELNEAIEWLKEYAEWVNKLNTQHPDTMGVAIDTVLTELSRLQKANETLNNFIEWGTNPFAKEIKEEK